MNNPITITTMINSPLSNVWEYYTSPEHITGFLLHLFWFVLVNIGLYILDYSDNSKITWAYWTTFGWGIGIVSHGFSVFALDGLSEKITNAVYKI